MRNTLELDEKAIFDDAFDLDVKIEHVEATGKAEPEWQSVTCTLLQCPCH